MNFFSKNIVIKNLQDYILLLLGCFLIAISFNLFLLPNNIASGGIPGLSIVLNKIFGINTAYLQFYINIPLFIIGLFRMGPNFLLKTIIGSFAIPEFILLTQKVLPMTNNVLIAAILGGIGTGVGLYFIVTSNSAVCGFTLLSKILHEYTKIKFSILIMFLNFFVIAFAVIIIGFLPAVFAFLSLLITSMAIELSQNISNFLNKIYNFKKLG
ncbi:YitT family protein [Candidatus Dependentiae bacterium]|nr:YitT family protein [Candidatus Dependentiae bacterium]MBU4387622.1 YitT family protein [Candidatus Dependentiae bacterium]MCG2756465.1 YitT family protein [Candidatus Dependentiae bacterium]